MEETPDLKVGAPAKPSKLKDSNATDGMCFSRAEDAETFGPVIVV